MDLSRNKDFYRHLFRLMLPIFLQLLLKISVDTVDSLMLGSIDQIQMSALSQANQIFFVFSTICNGFSAGCCVLISQHWGKKDYESICTIAAHGLRIITVFGLIVSVLVGAFPQVFMRIYSSDPTIISIGAQHLRRISLMYTMFGISNMIFGISRGIEQVRIILASNIVSYSVNILLDYLLIFGRFGFPELGIRGVAIGTVIARFIEFLFCGIFFLKEPSIPFMWKDLKRSDPKLRSALIKVSAPIVAHEIVWSLGTSSGAMITGQLGKSAVAGYNVMYVLYELCATVGNGFSSATNVVLGMTLGRGEKEEAKRQAHSILAIALAIGFAMSAITLLVRDGFLSLYSLDPDALHYAKQFILIIACIWPFSLIEMVTMVSILRAGGEGQIGFYTDIVVMWMICIPLAAFCAFRLHTEPWIVVAIIKNIIVLEAIVGIIKVYTYKWVKDLTTDQ